MRKKIIYLSLILSLFIVSSSAFATESVKTTMADNSAVNVRDRNPAQLTPMDQSNDRNDLAITQSIRQMLIKNKVLSVNAKNVKVITKMRKVTLRGPVNSVEEKNTVEKIAFSVAGPGKLTNELEIVHQ